MNTVRKLLWQEEKKFFGHKKVVGLLLLSYLLVGIYLFFDVGTTYVGEKYTADEYSVAVKKLKQIPDYKKDDFFGKLQQEQTKSVINKNAYFDLEKEWENIKRYPKYLKKLKATEEADSWYEDTQSSYEKKEKAFVKKQYQQLSEKRVTFLGAKGVEKTLQTDFCDYAFIFALLLLILGLVSMEYEENAMELLNSTRVGSKKIGISKFLAGFFWVFLGFVVMYGCKTGIYAMSYHFSEWNQKIQSVNGYESAVFRGSIKEFMILFYGAKLIGSLLLYTIFYFFACICKKSHTMLIAAMAFLLCGIGIQLWIPDTSYFVLWKRFYPLKGMDTSYLLRSFYTVNWFDNPVSYFKVLIGFELLLLLIAFVIGSLYYGKVDKQRKTHYSLSKSKSNLIHKIKCKNFFSWEFRKSWLGQAAGILVCVLIVATIAFYRPITESLVTETEVYYKSYIKKEQNANLKQAKKYYQKEKQRLLMAEEDLNKNRMKYSANACILIENDIKRKPALEKALEYVSYLDKKASVQLVYERGYQMLFGKNIPGGYLPLCNIIAVFMMVILTVPLWGMEEWTGMEKVLYATKAGYGKISRKKFFISIVYACLIFVILYGSWCINVYHSYELTHMKASIQSIRDLSFLPSWVTIEMYAFFYYGLHFVYLIVIGIGTKYVRKFFHSFVLSGVVSFLIFVIPFLFIR